MNLELLELLLSQHLVHGHIDALRELHHLLNEELLRLGDLSLSIAHLNLGSG